MFIKQISIFLENNPGTLRELTELLGKGGIDLMALSVADTQNFGIVRVIVRSDRIDPALALLREGGYTARVNNVLCCEVPDRPLGRCELLTIVEEAGLSVEYMYSFLRGSTDDKAHLVLRLSDGQKGLQVFQLKGVKLFGQDAVDAL